MESDGKLPLGSLHSAILQPSQETQYGTRNYIVKVPQPTPEQTEDAKKHANERFQEELAYQVLKDRKLGFLEKLIKRHIVRLRTQFVDRIPTSQWSLLIRPAILSFTLNAIDRQVRLSMQDGTHHYLGQRFSDAIAVVSVVPALRPSQAMTYFPGGYLATLFSIMNKYQFHLENSSGFIHWIFCFDSSTNAHSINLSFIPSISSGMALSLWALDLLSMEEKRQLPNLEA
jgi:hypothetical protein